MLRRNLRRLRTWLRYRGTDRYCPVCRHSAKAFLPTGVHPRPDALCPWCRSTERDRLSALFLDQKTDLFDGVPRRVLHVAPEPCLQSRFQRTLGAGYVTADLHRRDVMEQMDITDIKHPDASFDVIYCSHVLEHVDNDRQAMREFHRILRPGGWAILNVPVTADQTFEDPSITDPDERTRLFGQDDHVRRYGPDYIDRLKDVGFEVTVINASDLVQQDEAVTLGIAAEAAGDVYHCRKHEG